MVSPETFRFWDENDYEYEIFSMLSIAHAWASFTLARKQKSISFTRASLTTLSLDYLSTHPECTIVDENLSYISQKILEATDHFIPHKMSKGKRHLPWVSSSVKHLMIKRNRAYKKACRSGKAVHLTKYKRRRNITTKRLRVAHDKYLNDVMDGLTPESLGTEPENVGSNGIKRALSYLKLLRTESLGIPALVSNNRVRSSDSTKAEALRAQYDSVLIEEDLSNLPLMPPRLTSVRLI